MEYILIDGESARSLVTKNQQGQTNYTGTGYPFSLGGVFAPVQVITDAAGLAVKVLLNFKTSFVLTVKAGFQITTSNGTVYTISDDVDFLLKEPGSGYTKVTKHTLSFSGTDTAVSSIVCKNNLAMSNLPAVPQKDGYFGYWTIDGIAVNEYSVYSYGADKTATAKYISGTDLSANLVLGDWGFPTAEPDTRYLWFHEHTGLPATIYTECWNDHRADNAALNNGVDLMDYILIDEKSARSIVTQNAADRKYTGATAPLSYGGVFAPIGLFTNGSGIAIKVLESYKTEFILTFKAGFQINSNGTLYYLSEDVKYQIYAAGGNTRVYDLTFAGTDTVKTIAPEGAIGALPAVPEKAGCTGVWTIDGVEITADTVYNYGANKTATVQYSQDITDTLTLSDWGDPESAGVSFIAIQNSGVDIATPFETQYRFNCWNDNGTNSNVNHNFGVDPLAYIEIDGETVRSIVEANAASADPYKGTTEPSSWGGRFAPILVYTSNTTISVRILTTYKTDFKITIKAGFTLLNSDGVKLYTTRDITYAHTESSFGVYVPPTYEEVNINSTLTIADWANAESLEYSYIMVTNNGETLEAADDLKVFWNDHASSAAANDGCDIMEYIYINGVSARSLVTTNSSTNEYKGSDALSAASNPLGLGGVFAPVTVETLAFNGGSIVIKVLTSYAETGTFTLSFMPGFKLLNKNNLLLTLTEEVQLKYTVNYFVEGELYATEQVLPNENPTKCVRLTKEETEAYTYIHSGWYDGDQRYQNNSTVTKNTDLTAVFQEKEKEKYTVTFNKGNDESPDTVIVYTGCTVAKPEDPVKEMSGYDYVFLGWYNGDTPYDFSSVVTADLTLTAKWGTRKALNLSDLYNAEKAYSADLQDGQAEIYATTENTEGKVQMGYNPNDAFSLAFEFTYTDQVDSLASFDIKMVTASNNVESNTNPFYLGWRFYLYRDAGGTPNPFRCVQFLQYGDVYNDDQLVENDKRKAFATRENADASYYNAGETYQVKIGYRLLDAATGTVEMTVQIGEWIEIVTHELGAEYYTEYYKNVDHLLFTAEQTAKTVTLADWGMTGVENYEYTLVVGSNSIKEYGTLITLPNLDPDEYDMAGNVLVGWTTDPANLTNLYPVGYKYSADGGATLSAVWLGFSLQDGAAVRAAVGNSGIRFLVDVDANGYKIGVEKGLILSAGTFIVPTTYLASVPEFTHAYFPTGYYSDIKADLWKTKEGDVWTYTAALVNISDTQLARSMSARGYLKIQFTTGEGYVYTDYNKENNARSIYEVATKAYKEGEKPQAVLDYVDKVADVTIDENFNLVKNNEAVGAYTITNVSNSGATFTLTVDSTIKAAVINGTRAVVGATENIKIGKLLYGIKNYSVNGNQLSFTLGAANKDSGKVSKETLYFDSSDESLDAFLNDYFKRHSGYVENGVDLKVNSATGGVSSEEFFSHEWLSNSYYWFNSFDGYNDVDRIEGMRNFLSSVPVDDYGYVWQSNDRVRNNNSNAKNADIEQRMGWPFPSPYDVNITYWEFSGSDSTVSCNISASTGNGLYTATANNTSGTVEFAMEPSSWSISKRIYTYYAPLLEFDIRIADASNVEDIYVYYTTSSSKNYSEDKKVSVKEKAFMSYEYSGKYEHLVYLPMYAEAAWAESTSTYVTGIKIVVAIKSGKTMTGAVSLNSVYPVLDTRHSNNNSILISSLRTDYDYTGDLDYLAENITRARKAMNFLMQMYDSTRGLNKQSYLVGHDGKKEALSWGISATNKSIAGSLSNGYWDIMYMPEYDFQSNMYFYKALEDMAYLEGILEDNGITVDKSLATIKTAPRIANGSRGTSAYGYTSDSLSSVAETVLTNLRKTTENTNHTGFWNASTDRFVAGYASNESTWYDYGYVTWNLEAIQYGIATPEQAASIMNWLSSEAGLYDYVFAPRSITVNNTNVLNGQYEEVGKNWSLGGNCQYGGAIMYSSYFDLMSRIDVLGADNAFDRLQAIQGWYEEIKTYYDGISNADPYNFYRYYYENKGITMQGLGTAGSIGIDREFLESLLPISSVAYGFFGIDSIDGKTLQIAPELPAELSCWSMENLAFNMVKYDLTIYDNAIQITDVRGTTTGLKLQVVLDKANGQKVYVNGAETNDYTESNGKVYVNVATFGATIVEVR